MHRISSPHDREITALRGYIETEIPNRFSTQTGQSAVLPKKAKSVGYGDTEYLDFPIPRMVFGIRTLRDGRAVDCSMGVVADEPPTGDTKMYHYPFSNVYDDLRVCVGNNVLPHFKSQTQLSKFPRFLLGIPNNDDFFKVSHNRLHMPHRELLEHLKDKEPAYYYTDVLVENGKTLSDFINGR